VSEYQALADFWMGNLWRAVRQKVREVIKSPWL
jgi:hypothetical protein